MDEKKIEQLLKEKPVKAYFININALLFMALLCFSLVFNIQYIRNAPNRIRFSGIRSFKFARALPYKRSINAFAVVYALYTVNKIFQLYFVLLFDEHIYVSIAFFTAVFQVLSIYLILKSTGIKLKNLRKRLLKQARRIIQIYIFMIIPVFIATTFSASLTSMLGLPLTPMPFVEIMLDNRLPAVLFIFMAIEAAVLAPVAEELIFRGILFSTLRNNFSFGFSALVSALLFAVLHDHFTSFLPIAVLAVALSWLYEKTNNLSYSIILHSIYNSISLAMMLNFKFLLN